MRLLLSVLVLVPQLAFAISPESIPAPGPNSWVVDLTGRIPSSDVAQANALAQSANDRKLGQVAVLIIETTNGRDARRFAEQVHFQWKIGTGRGDGILFFVALNDRAAETLLPFGLRSDQDQQRSDQAMQQVIVPAFKRGAQGEAIREGTRALVKLLEHSPLNNKAAQSPKADAQQLELAPTRAERSPTQLPNPAARGFSVDASNALSASAKQELEAALNGLYADGHGKLYVYTVRASDFATSLDDIAASLLSRLHPAATPGVQVAVIATDNAKAAIAGESLKASANGWAIAQLLDETQQEMAQLYNPDEHVVRFAQRYDTLVTYGPKVSNYTGQATTQLSRSISRNSAPFLFGFLFVGGGAVFGLMKWMRFRKRRCKVCGDPRQRLGEHADDAYISEGQKHEEDLGSVDYDVWWCARCEDALVLRYKAFLTSYRSCPKCEFVCAMQTTKTLIHATYDSGGKVEVTLNCTRCNHHQSSIRYTSRLTRSTTSTRSSFGSSSSGGGRSSFGGSSGRW